MSEFIRAMRAAPANIPNMDGGNPDDPFVKPFPFHLLHDLLQRPGDERDTKPQPLVPAEPNGELPPPPGDPYYKNYLESLRLPPGQRIT